jgi:hypothetical protein
MQKPIAAMHASRRFFWHAQTDQIIRESSDQANYVGRIIPPSDSQGRWTFDRYRAKRIEHAKHAAFAVTALAHR